MKEVNIISSVVGRDNVGKSVGSTAPSIGAYALKSELSALQSVFNDFLEGDDTDMVINRWKELEAFLNGISEDNTLSSILGDYIPIQGYTDILGEKNFTGGLKVNGSPIVYDADNKYWKLEGDLLVTGEVTMYANEGTYTPSTIMDAIAVDGTTISKDGGVLKVIGSVGGATTLGSLTNVGSWADSVASQDRIMYQAANSSQWVAKNLSDLAVGGVTGDYLPLTGGTISGALTVSNGNQWTPIKINRAEWGESTFVVDSNGLYISHTIDSVQAYLQLHPTNGFKFNGNTILHAGNYSSYALPLSGGTITSAGVPLTINRTGYTVSAIHFQTNGTNVGRIGVGEDNNPKFMKAADGTWHNIWHAGNDGSGSGLDADLLDGYDSSLVFINRNIALNANTINTTLIPGCYHTANYSPISGAYKYGTILNFRGGARQSQFYIPDGAQAYPNGGRLFFRDHWNANEAIETSWYEILTSASVGSFNAGSATKLQTARTIWGQSFNGTADITGDLNLGLSRILGIDNAFLITSSADSVTFGYGTSAKGIPTYIDGNAVYVRYGTTRTTGLFVSSAGNVGIGTTSPSHKMHVAGDMIANGWLRTINGNGWHNDTYGGGIYMVDDQLVRIYGGKILYTGEGSSSTIVSTNSYGIGGHNLTMLIGNSFSHSSILMRSNTVCWGIAANNNGNMYIGKRPTTSHTNNANDAYTLVLSGQNLLCYGGVTMYSDARKKTILNHVELSLKEIADAPLIEHYYNSDEKKTTHVGSIAQYWAGLNDWFCKLDNEGYYTMEIQNAALASAISVARELVKFETETDRRIRLLEEENEQLKKEIEILKWNIA